MSTMEGGGGGCGGGDVLFFSSFFVGMLQVWWKDRRASAGNDLHRVNTELVGGLKVKESIDEVDLRGSS